MPIGDAHAGLRNAPLAAGAERVELDPGDVCVFDAWGVHRARYRHGQLRRTLDLLFGFGPKKRLSYNALLGLARRPDNRSSRSSG